MIRLDKSRKADTNATLMVIIGLVIVAAVLVLTFYIMNEGTGYLWDQIKAKIAGEVEDFINPDSAYTAASTASFNRLNEEFKILIKNEEDVATAIIPYTLGQYRLVGFNKDSTNSINRACLGENIALLRPDTCTNQACLCLCTKEEKCDKCIGYPDIDFILTYPDEFRNEGDSMGVVTGSNGSIELECLMIKGANNEDDHLKMVEPYSSWWRSRNIEIRKDSSGSKDLLLIRSIEAPTPTRMIIRTERVGTLATVNYPGLPDIPAEQIVTPNQIEIPDGAAEISLIFTEIGSQSYQNPAICKLENISLSRIGVIEAATTEINFRVRECDISLP